MEVDDFGKWKMGRFNEYCRQILLFPQKKDKRSMQERNGTISEENDHD